MTPRSVVLVSVDVLTLTHCGAASSACDSGVCAQGGLVLNELAGTAEKGLSLARVHDGAETFAVQRRSPGTANAP